MSEQPENKVYIEGVEHRLRSSEGHCPSLLPLLFSQEVPTA